MSAAEALAIGQQPAGPVGRGSGLSLRFLGSELRIIGGRRRNIAGLAVLAVVPIVLAIAVRASAPDAGEGPPPAPGVRDRKGVNAGCCR